MRRIAGLGRRRRPRAPCPTSGTRGRRAGRRASTFPTRSPPRRPAAAQPPVSKIDAAQGVPLRRPRRTRSARRTGRASTTPTTGRAQAAAASPGKASPSPPSAIAPSVSDSASRPSSDAWKSEANRRRAPKRSGTMMRDASAGSRPIVPSSSLKPSMIETAASAKVPHRSSTRLDSVAVLIVATVASRRRSLAS